MIRLADYIIKFLEKKKISTVFTVSGGGSIFLCDALYKSKKLIIYHITMSKQPPLLQKVTQERKKMLDVVLSQLALVELILLLV